MSQRIAGVARVKGGLSQNNHDCDNDVNAVSARELWAKLGSSRDFSNWIKQRIEKYDFLEGTDYAVPIQGKGESSGFQPIEYFISLDMAKELSMVENNAQDVDFIKLTLDVSSPNPPQDYAVTIEMATHLAMMAKTQRAHSITPQKYP